MGVAGTAEPIFVRPSSSVILGGSGTRWTRRAQSTMYRPEPSAQPGTLGGLCALTAWPGYEN